MAGNSRIVELAMANNRPGIIAEIQGLKINVRERAIFDIGISRPVDIKCAKSVAAAPVRTHAIRAAGGILKSYRPIVLIMRIEATTPDYAAVATPSDRAKEVTVSFEF